MHDYLLAQEYNRGYNAAMSKQLHYIDQEERRFTAAVAAMQGLMASPTTSIHADVLMIARDAVKQADALLEELAE